MLFVKYLGEKMTDPVPVTGAKSHSWAIVPYVGNAQEARMDKLIKHSFELQKAETRLLPLVGHVTVLIGTSSVGKSSIIAAMRATDAELQETGADLVGCDSAYEHFKATNPDALKFLQSVLKSKPHQNHIHDAVGDELFNFKDSVSESDRLQAKAQAALLRESLQTLPQLTIEEFEFSILDRAMQLSLGGKPCIFDLIKVDSVAKHALGRMPKKVALVYCPLEVYVSRIQNRNQKALRENEPGELRLGVFHLLQMADVFRPITGRDEPVLFSITREELTNNFNILFDDWVRLGGSNIGQRDEELTKVLEAFGFTDPSVKTLNYTPRFNGYDAIIDTSVVDSKGAAKILRK